MEFKLPDIGEGVHEGEITKWLVKPGDNIKSDQPMVEVMTDKATVEIPSPVTGVVDKLMAKEGETIEVGKVLLTITEAGKAAAPAKETKEAPEKAAPKAAAKPEAKAAPSDKGHKAPSTSKVEKEQKPEGAADKEDQEAGSEEEEGEGASKAKPAQKATPAQGREGKQQSNESKPQSNEALPLGILATPATRKLARDLDVDLREVKGTGPHNRVTKMDVQMVYEGQQAGASRSSHPADTGTALEPSRPKPPAQVHTGAVERIPLKGIRKKIAEAMAHSKHTAAHFTYVEEVDMSEVVRLRSSVAEEAKKRGIKLTYLPFIIKAVIPALKEFPFLNSSLDDEKQEIVLKKEYNIGIATDTPNGLVVPVIKNADRKSIWELAKEITDLSEKARTGKLTLDEMRGGTYTLTNAGSIGGVFATPVINHPEVAILGVNAIRKRPVVKNDQIVIAEMMFLSISVDHRVVDGADAARFMNRLVFFLSEPTRLVFA